jgi:hypothetical protein
MGRTLQEVIESLPAAPRAAVEARAEEGELTDSDGSDIRNEALEQLRARQRKR